MSWKPGVAVLFAAAALLIQTGRSSAQTFSAEQLAKWHKEYPKADANGDGKLTEQEAIAYYQKVIAPAAGGQIPPPTHANAKYGPHQRNVLDFWQAKGDGPAPVVIYIHGGGFVGGDKSTITQQLISGFHKAGIHVAAMNYRFVSETPFPAPMQDGARAVQFLRSKAQEWNVDPARIGAFGGSAGAAMSLWLGFHDDLADANATDPLAKLSTRLAVVGDIAGQATLDPKVLKEWIGGQAYRHPSILPFYGVKTEADLAKPPMQAIFDEASPIKHLSKDDPPVFMIFYDADVPLPAGAKPGEGIHHPALGLRLKEQMDKLGVENVFRGADVPIAKSTEEMIAFFVKQLKQPPAKQQAGFPGRTERGFLLPNGWTVSPAGEQVALTDLPLNILPLADNRHALVATSGYNSHELTLVDLENGTKVASQTVKQSWFGLAASPKQDTLWWSGGGGNALHAFTLEDGKLAPAGELTQPPAGDGAKNFQSGLLHDPETKTLYSLDIDAGEIAAIDLAGGKAARSGKLGGRPYDAALSKNRAQLYVSDWTGRRVLLVDPKDLSVVGKIVVGEHPNQLVLHPTDDRLFVACASTNNVAVIDTRRGVVTETIFTALFPNSPEGSTPDALAVSPDGKSLYVANADNNCVAVVDISIPSKSQVQGFIPTGWYPTALAVTPDGKRLLVGVGKGNETQANPTRPRDAAKPADARRNLPFPYIGTTLSGSLSIVPIPSDEQLAAYTEVVYRNCPYSDKLLTDAPYPEKTAVPNKVGDPSPIKHVIYIIKENRTYDQVFGDMPRGNGDPSLVLFGEQVTPNHHKLANEFVLLDNLYCNGHVSADGHPWSTMAYNTDYTARNWALTYSKRAGIEEDEEGNLQKAPGGYIWDACARLGLAYRSYGEYGARVSQPDGTFRVEGRVPGLVGHTSPTYGAPKAQGAPVRDSERLEAFLAEFAEYEKNGDLPRFIIMSLGEDHTTGTSPGTFTPQACVANNDLALGKLVEAVSKSKYWPQTAIFVIEDDAQNGPDHVDAHRTVGLAISPYVKRGSLDSNQYTTVSLIRTMELILGVPPLSQYDAAARPMFASFSDQPDLKQYEHLPARIDLNAKNTPQSYGADRSAKMDFTEYDEIDDFELNEILWRAVKGKDAPLPPAVRRAIAYRLTPR